MFENSEGYAEHFLEPKKHERMITDRRALIDEFLAKTEQYKIGAYSDLKERVESNLYDALLSIFNAVTANYIEMKDKQPISIIVDIMKPVRSKDGIPVRKQILVGNLGKFKLKEGLEVVESEEGNAFCIEAREIGVVACGESRGEALKNLINDLECTIEGYASEDDSNLTLDAIELKRSIHSKFDIS